MIPKGTGGSNPSLSASFPSWETEFHRLTGPVEKYPSGRRGSPAKGVVCESAARVQIPPSPPPKDTDVDTMSVFFLFAVSSVEDANIG